VIVVVQFDPRHAAREAALAGADCLSDQPPSHITALSLGHAVSMELSLTAVARLMVGKGKLTFKRNEPSGECAEFRDYVARKAEACVAAFENLEILSPPDVLEDSEAGGYWVAARVFVKL
jgi:hypothetical protein